jgi:hypothetical protein
LNFAEVAKPAHVFFDVLLFAHTVIEVSRLVHGTALVLAIVDFVMISQNILMQVLNLNPVYRSIIVLTWKTDVQSMGAEDKHNSSFQDCTNVRWFVTGKSAAEQGKELFHGDAAALVILRLILFLHIICGIGSATIFG